MRPQLVLASASDRRQRLLKQLGYDFVVLPADIDETVSEGERASEYVLRMSLEKAQASASLLRQSTVEAEPCSKLILAADTIVCLDEKIVGKPCSKDDFVQTMKALSGQKHQVITAVCLGLISDSDESTFVEVLAQFAATTDVFFKTLSQSEIDAYWATGEPLDKAGGYGIQGLGNVFIERIVGSYTNVVGLPLKEVAEALSDSGLSIWDNTLSNHGLML